MENVLILLALGLAHQHFTKSDVTVDEEVQKQIAYKIDWQSEGNFTAKHGDVKWVIITDD